MKAKSWASYPSSPVTIQRHRNPRTVLHLRTDHSYKTEPRMIDQLDNKPIPIPSISDNPSIEDKTRPDKQLLSDNCFILWCWGGRAASCGYTAAPWPRYTARSAARTRWTSPRAQWITFRNHGTDVYLVFSVDTSEMHLFGNNPILSPILGYPSTHYRPDTRPGKQLLSTVSPSVYLFISLNIIVTSFHNQKQYTAQNFIQNV